MSEHATHEGQEILKLITAVTRALKSEAGSHKLGKPEVAAALLKVLRSVVSAKAGQTEQEASALMTSTFAGDIEAIQHFLAQNGMA